MRVNSVGGTSVWFLIMFVGLLPLLAWAGGGTETSGALDLPAGGVLDIGVPADSLRNDAGYFRVGPGQLNAGLVKKDFIMINVHVPYGGQIAGTDMNIPYTDVDDIVARYPDRGRRLVLYCQGGPMSTAASKALVQRGYTNIVELEGGFDAWIRAGYEFIYPE